MKEAICHICLKNRPMTKNHVPALGGFNSGPIIYTKGKNIVRSMEYPNEPVRTSMNHNGMYYLNGCGECNNGVGSIYASEYIRWANAVDNSFNQNVIFDVKDLKPLLFIKQLIFDFLIINNISFSQEHILLAKFLLDKNMCIKLAPKYNIYIGVNIYGDGRVVGGPSFIEETADNWLSSDRIYLSEIVHYPFAYQLVLDKKINAPHRSHLVDITHFSEDIEIVLPDLPLVKCVGALPNSFEPA